MDEPALPQYRQPDEVPGEVFTMKNKPLPFNQRCAVSISYLRGERDVKVFKYQCRRCGTKVEERYPTAIRCSVCNRRMTRYWLDMYGNPVDKE